MARAVLLCMVVALVMWFAGLAVQNWQWSNRAPILTSKRQLRTWALEFAILAIVFLAVVAWNLLS